MTKTSRWVTTGRQESRSTSGVSSVPAANHDPRDIAVQKYGGSSLPTIGQIRQVAHIRVSAEITPHSSTHELRNEATITGEQWRPPHERHGSHVRFGRCTSRLQATRRSTSTCASLGPGSRSSRQDASLWSIQDRNQRPLPGGSAAIDNATLYAVYMQSEEQLRRRRSPKRLTELRYAKCNCEEIA